MENINETKRHIKMSIENLINQNKIKDADILTDEYMKVIKDDAEIYSIKSVICIKQGKIDEAQEVIMNGLKIEKNNFDLNYNLAYIYETKGLYLKAVETYEKIVFNLEDAKLQKEIIEYLNAIEESNKDIILKQLASNQKKYEEISENKVNLHVMYDSQYCDRFIKFVNQKYPDTKNKFVIIHNKDQKLRLMDIDDQKNVEILDLRYDLNKLLLYIQNSSKIFIHYLFDYFCELVCKFNIQKPIYWMLWGGDLYHYIDIKLYDESTEQLLKTMGYNVKNGIKKDQIMYLYRKATIRKIQYILTFVEGDYLKVKSNFITNAKMLNFMYPNVINIDNLKINISKSKYNFKDKYKYVILAGNSADPCNNHMEILEKLNNIKLKDFCILMPLSYGGDKHYIDYIIKEGKRLFQNSFIPLLEYLPPNEYFSILSQVDVAMFNHNRQQALGNIFTLLYLGKKVYIKSNITSYKFLIDNNIKVYDINNIDRNTFFEFSEEYSKSNKDNIKFWLNEKTYKKFLDEIL